MRRLDDWLHDNADALVAGAFVVIMGAMALLMGGCSSYTVVAADRRLVPVRHAPEVSADVYLRTEGKNATGWYVPDALMLELMEGE